MIPAERDRTALKDLVAFGSEAEVIVARGKQAYLEDLILQRAAQMICVHLGEAAKRLSPEVVAAHPEIRFSLMVALRDKVAHGYRVLDVEVIWETIATAIPADVLLVRRLLSEH